ncbi:CBS domain-containing protein [Sporosarcina sp. Marseille-Q4063]|uniref:CBS domain-containing protein n=1 Tax=Sporosarcina sp. Marseille-Q4063 TaxID=2810514 RepID=UPI001BAE76A9|nr:CBS domain-containing protein [Sporosarcina sp. Marseille-Q4063]QUW20594.1 CBS domain-containing protein [Sporosarcina sp. Marseille-Q4063]
MFVRDLYLEKHEVVTVNTAQSVGEVYEIIEKSGYRCIPVIDNDSLYKGMIYKVHLMEDIYENNGDKNATINHLLKHDDLFIAQHTPFLNALVAIKSLPFISVVEDGKLIGILTHNKVESVLEDAFGMKTGGINITISSVEARGMIGKLTKVLRGENIEGMFTLDNGSVIARRVVITLENGKTDEEITEIKEKLEKSGFRILHIDRIVSK